MNHWGGASLLHSGEIFALYYVREKLKNRKQIVLFDVGANRGEYTILAHQLLKNLKSYSFEPSKNAFALLTANTKDVDCTNRFNIGFGEMKKHVKLYSPGEGSTVASLYNHDTFNELYTEDILISTIDEFCRENNIGRIDFLKIDIEGHELYALKGAKDLIHNKKIAFIQFEFGEFHIDSRTFFRDFYALFDKDYIFYRIVSDGLRPIKCYSTDLEIFNTANFLIELKQPTVGKC